MSASVVELYSI